MLRLIAAVVCIVLSFLVGCLITYEWVSNDVEKMEVPGQFVYTFPKDVTMTINKTEDKDFVLTEPITVTKIVNGKQIDVVFVPQLKVDKDQPTTVITTDLVAAIEESSQKLLEEIQLVKKQSDTFDGLLAAIAADVASQLGLLQQADDPAAMQPVMDKLKVIDTDIDVLATSIGKLPTSVSFPELQTVVRRTEEMQQTLSDISTAIGQLPDGIPSVSVREVPVSAPAQEFTLALDKITELLTSVGDIGKDVDKLLEQNKDDVSDATVQELTTNLDDVFDQIKNDLSDLLDQGKDDASEDAVQAVIRRLNDVRKEIGKDIDLLVMSKEKDIPHVSMYVPEVQPEAIQPAPLVPEVRTMRIPPPISLIGVEDGHLIVPDLEQIHAR